jgi:hypothetical protein
MGRCGLVSFQPISVCVAGPLPCWKGWSAAQKYVAKGILAWIMLQANELLSRSCSSFQKIGVLFLQARKMPDMVANDNGMKVIHFQCALLCNVDKV